MSTTALGRSGRIPYFTSQYSLDENYFGNVVRRVYFYIIFMRFIAHNLNLAKFSKKLFSTFRHQRINF